MKTQQNNKGLALIISLSVLFGLSVIAVSFVTITSINRRSTSNFAENIQAKMLARSGIDYAIARIASGYEKDEFFKDWVFSKADIDSVEEAFFNRKIYADDNIGTGVAIEDVQEILNKNIEKDTNNPSFRIHSKGRNTSGSMIDLNHTYTLKVMDCSGQLNINSRATFLADMLNNLSKAIALRAPYINEKGNDGLGPLKGLGETIVAKRPEKGYSNKREIIGISDGIAKITSEDFTYIEDLLTTFPSTEQMEENPIYSSVAFSNLGDEKNYKSELRSPININTASWPILFTIFFNLRAADMSNEPIRMVSRLTDRIKFLEERLTSVKLLGGVQDLVGGILQPITNLLQPLTRIIANLTERLDIANLQLDKFQKILLDQGNEPIFFTISEGEAITLANRICSRRRANPFKDWEDFENFLNDIENIPIFERDRRQKISMIKANCDSSISLDRLNPDNTAYHSINKSELLYSTTELAFFPLGCFEIACLAEIFDSQGDIITSAKNFAEVSIFDVISEKSQRDFVTNQPQDFTAKIENDAFVLGNNLQGADPKKASSSVFAGSVNGTAYSIPTGYDNIDEPREIFQGGLEPAGEGGNYLFRADFNGTVDANKAQNPQAHGTKKDAINKGGLALPNEENGSGVFADLVADGIILSGEDDNIEDALFYLSRPNENAKTDDPSIDGNFPALATGVDIASLDGEVNEGSLMFWLKINENWNDEVWRTLFFINTAFEVKNEETDEVYLMGVQREVQVKVEKESGDSLLRNVGIQMRTKFFCLVDGVPVKPPSNFMPYSNIDSGKRIELSVADDIGMNAQEFYHISIRWRDGTNLKGFSKQNALDFLTNDQDDSIAVSGDFYNKDGQKNDANILYDKDLPFLDVENKSVTTQQYSALSKEEAFIPLDDRITKLNRFYVGCVGRTLSAEGTVDDIRVTKNSDWAHQPQFRPSRNEIPKNKEEQTISTFVGQFDIENVRPLFATPTIVTPQSGNNQSIDFSFDRTTLKYTADFKVQQDAPRSVNTNPILLSANLLYFVKPFFRKYIEE